jgi:hypothetical protein
MTHALLAIVAASTLVGCVESERHVAYPDGTVTMEHGTCDGLPASDVERTCTDHHRLRVGWTAVIVAAAVVADVAGSLARFALGN